MALTNNTNQRSRAWVHNHVQGALGKRIAVYWCLFLVFTITIAFTLKWLSEGSFQSPLKVFQSVVHENRLVIFVVLALLPWFIRDCLKLSHRFSGPIVRLRRAMRDLSSGHDSGPLTFRKGDFWPELAEDFNRLRDRLLASKSDSRHATYRNASREYGVVADPFDLESPGSKVQDQPSRTSV